MTQIDPSSLAHRIEAMPTAPMGDEVAMMDLDTGRYMVLDRMGAVIWEALEQPVRIDALISGLAARYDVGRERCEAEVLAFLGQLRDRGLVRVWDA